MPRRTRMPDGRNDAAVRTSLYFVVVVVVVVLVLPVVAPEWQTSTDFIAVSASVRLENTWPPPTTTVVLVVGFCSTMVQRLVEVS